MLERFWFTVLGPVQAWRGEHEVDLGSPQQRAVLALLLARAGEPVTIAEIVDTLWWQGAPQSAVNTVHRSIGQLRRALEPHLAARETGGWLVRAGGGYRLRADAASADLVRFRELVERARVSRADAVDCYAQALGLWRGAVAEDIGSEVRETPVFAAISREYVVAAREAADVALAARGDRVLLPLVELAADRAVLDEPLQARVVSLLAVCGRQTDALDRFEKVRVRLRDDLGLDPGGELLSARDGVLRPLEPAAAPASALPGPAQLPGDLPTFVGRADELAALRANAQPGRSVVITAIGGMAGIGKTSLAVHWAHRIAGEFPDGQLYANLRGFDPGGPAAAPAEVLRAFLEALGVAAGQIPHELDARAALFRSKLSGRRFLMLLDNARDTAQVRPLLPGTASCLVLVTSRDRLAGLVASQGAWPVVLSAMGEVEARQLLSERLGEQRVLADPGAVDAIMAICAGLPLGLTIVAARAATRPDLSLREISAGLTDAVQRLDALTTGDPHTDIRAVFSWSYQGLTADAARVFRLLGLHTAPDIALNAAASLAGMAPARLRTLLAELVDAALVTRQADDRYVLHDLLRAYAAETCERVDPVDARRAAVGRLLDHYVQTAFTADRLLNPIRQPVPLDAPQAAVTLPYLSARAEAVEWFTAEHQALRSAVNLAAEQGFDTQVWQLAWALADFLTLRGHWSDHVEVETAAIDAARRLADVGNEAYARRMRAHAQTRLSRLDEAVDDLETALDLYRQASDPAGQAYAHLNLGMVWDRRGRHRDALSHAQRAAQLFQLAGDKRGQANALSAAGWEHGQLGDYEGSRDACQQALAVFEALGDRGGQSNTWDSLGYAYQHLGQHAEAIRCFDESLLIVRDIGDRYGEATALTHRGDACAAVGDAAAAHEAWRQALLILDELQHPDADAVRGKLG